MLPLAVYSAGLSPSQPHEAGLLVPLSLKKPSQTVMRKWGVDAGQQALEAARSPGRAASSLTSRLAVPSMLRTIWPLQVLVHQVQGAF